MKRWLCLILLFLPLLASAASFWDGNAALQRGDSTFESDMYAASSSFPEGTRIVILNIDTGKSTTATVTNRVTGQPDILVLLAPKTAQALGVLQGVMASVRVTIAPPLMATTTASNGEQSASQDPDLNPGVAYGGPTSATPPSPETQAAATQTIAAPDPTASQAQTATADTTAAQSTQTAAADATSTQTTQTDAASATQTAPADTAAAQTTSADAASTTQTTPEQPAPVITETSAEPATAAVTAQQSPPFATPETPQLTEQAAVDALPVPSLESLPQTVAPAQPDATALLPISSPVAPEPEQQQTTVTPAEATQPVQQPVQAAESTQPVVDEAAARQAENAAIIAAAEARTPQKQVFLPPREDSKFAYQKPAESTQQVASAQQATAVTATPTEPVAPQITSINGEPAAAPSSASDMPTVLAEAVVPQESSAEEIVDAAATPPDAVALQTQLAMAAPEPAPEEVAAVQLEPVQTEVTDPSVAPPLGKPVAHVALAAPDAPAPQTTQQTQTPTQTTVASSVSTVAKTPATTSVDQTASATSSAPTTNVAVATATLATLPKSTKADTFYLQLGAYATEKVARDLASSLSGTYPTLIVAPAATGTTVFKVVIGPLNKAESGTLLTWFRHRGFPDAFLKQE